MSVVYLALGLMDLRVCFSDFGVIWLLIML